ncbi:RDD family protein [Alteromonadaceae bacterium M269]|nr:RDD family protein [Alteromonadaceae bacterium M269]
MQEPSNTYPRASFFRRLAAMVYDVLVSVAVGMVAAMVMLLVLVILLENGVLDKGTSEHVSDVIQQSVVYKTLIQVWVAVWVLGFFTWFWKNGGQTIGMRAWRLRLFSTNSKSLSYGRVLLRILVSLGGIGTLLVLLDFRNKLALQDRIAQTEMLVLTKDANHHRSWKELQN